MFRIVVFLLIFQLITACSGHQPERYLASHNGRVVKVPRPLTGELINYQMTLPTPHKPIVADFKPPKI